MAKLTKTHISQQLEKERKRQEKLKQKLDIQEKKELYGENWKDVEKKKLQKEIETTLGSEKTPNLFDFKDRYDFFSPINFYKENADKYLKMDYTKFAETEEKYRKIMEQTDKDIEDIDQEIEEMIKAEKGVDAKKAFLEEDGSSDSDRDTPVVPQMLQEIDSTEEGAGDSVRREIQKSDIITNHPASIAKGRLNQIVSTYFNRFAPLYDKHVCTCCGTPKPIEQYYIVYAIDCCNRIDKNGNFHMHVCKECVQKMFAYNYTILTQKNIEEAMLYTCAQLNVYWDADLFQVARKKFEKQDRKGTLIGKYISEVNTGINAGKTFLNSPFIVDETYNQRERVVQVVEEEVAPLDWEREDVRNQKAIVKMVGYNPFEHEPEEDRKTLYRDLLNILDENMANDFVKLQAGIQIVQSFYKIRKMNEKQSKMEKDNAPLTDQKALSDLKAKELKSITDFSRDNGFAERFATAKAKGENTLTGIMNKMNEMNYEKAIANRYDIATSETIQQAADASFKAIFSQLSLGESEVWKITQDQFEELTKLRKELMETQEQLRKAKYRLAEIGLIEKERAYKQKMGLDGDDFQ